jgi:hypothetical protein
LKKLEQEMLAKRQLEEWRQAILGISVVNTLIVNNGKEYQSIVVGKTSKADAIYILKSAFIAHAGALAATESYPGSNEYIAIHKSAGSFPHIVVNFKGNMVEKIRFQGKQRGEILYSFENEMYGILTVIPPDGIKLW